MSCKSVNRSALRICIRVYLWHAFMPYLPLLSLDSSQVVQIRDFKFTIGVTSSTRTIQNFVITTWHERTFILTHCDLGHTISNFQYYFEWTQYANWDAAKESVLENESKRARGGPDSDTNLCLCFLAGPEKMQWICKWSMLVLAPPALWVSACVCVFVSESERQSERERHRLLSAEASVPATDQRNFIWQRCSLHAPAPKNNNVLSALIYTPT